jgi:hypothetical protein
MYLYIRLLDSRTHNFCLNPAIWQTITKKTPGGGGLGTHQIFNLQGSVEKFSYRAEMKNNIFILKMTRIYLLVFGLWFRGKLGNIDTIVIPHLGRRHALYYRLNKKKILERFVLSTYRSCRSLIRDTRCSFIMCLKCIFME